MCSGAKRYAQLSAYHERVTKKIMDIVESGPWKDNGKNAIQFLIAQLATSDSINWEEALQIWAKEKDVLHQAPYVLLKENLKTCLPKNRYEAIAFLCQFVA